MKYAVIRTGGKQYRVAANDVIKVEKLDRHVPVSKGDIVFFDDVLAIGEGGKVDLNAKGKKVSAEVINQAKDDKVYIFKKRRRHNYRRFKGHRQELVWVRIKEIDASGAPTKAVAKAEAPKKAEVKTEAAPKAKAPAKAKAAATGDDLRYIKGVGEKLNALLISLGVTSYSQIANWTEAEASAINEQLGTFKGRIVRDEWIEQCKLLAAGKTEEFNARFGELGSEIKKK